MTPRSPHVPKALPREARRARTPLESSEISNGAISSRTAPLAKASGRQRTPRAAACRTTPALAASRRTHSRGGTSRSCRSRWEAAATQGAAGPDVTAPRGSRQPPPPPADRPQANQCRPPDNGPLLEVLTPAAVPYGEVKDRPQAGGLRLALL